MRIKCVHAHATSDGYVLLARNAFVNDRLRRRAFQELSSKEAYKRAEQTTPTTIVSALDTQSSITKTYLGLADLELVN